MNREGTEREGRGGGGVKAGRERQHRERPRPPHSVARRQESESGRKGPPLGRATPDISPRGREERQGDCGIKAHRSGDRCHQRPRRRPTGLETGATKGQGGGPPVWRPVPPKTPAQAMKADEEWLA